MLLDLPISYFMNLISENSYFPKIYIRFIRLIKYDTILLFALRI